MGQLATACRDKKTLLHSRMLRAVKIMLSEGWRGLGRRLKARIHLGAAPSPLDEMPIRIKKGDKIQLSMLIPTMEAGGMERCAEVLLKHFNRELFELDLVMIFDREPFYPVPSDVKSYILERYRQPRVEACLDALSPDIAARYQEELTWLEATACKLGMLVGKLQSDIVLAQDFYAFAIALLAKKYMPKDVKIIGSLHSQYSTFLQTIQQGDLYAALIRRDFNEADRIIAVSQGIATDLIEHFGVRPDVIAVIHNPMDLAQIERLAQEPITEHGWFSEDVPLLLFVGRLNPEKGLVYLLQAAAQARKIKSFRVVLIGEGEQRHELEALARQLGVADDVLFLGAHKNPFKFLANADIFVMSSLWEGFGYVLVEALACGCPVVATNCPSGPAEILEDGKYGLLVPPANEQALAEAILQLLQNSELRTKLAMLGPQRARHFDAPEIVKQYEQLILDVAGRGTTSGAYGTR